MSDPFSTVVGLLFLAACFVGAAVLLVDKAVVRWRVRRWIKQARR